MIGTDRVTSADFGEASATASPLRADFLYKVPPLERYRDKVAIVGFTDHRIQALDLGDDFEIWGLNELYRYMPPERFHRWFEIHGRDYLTKDDEGKKHIEDLKSVLGPVPIYMQKQHEDIPGSVAFPIDELIAYWGGRDALGADYFTNCPAQMFSFALALGYSEIHMYGVDMANDTEYATQRPCCEYWIGRALGMGVKVHVPDTSDLLKCVGTYGYEDAGSTFSRKLQARIKWLHAMDNERLGQVRGLEASYRQQHAELTARTYRYEGALEELRTQKPRTPKRSDRITAVEAELASTRTDLKKMQAEYEDKSAALLKDRNQILGGIHDCEYWLRSWSMKADSLEGGNIPTPAERAADPRTAIQAPTGDSVKAEPAVVG